MSDDDADGATGDSPDRATGDDSNEASDERSEEVENWDEEVEDWGEADDWDEETEDWDEEVEDWGEADDPDGDPGEVRGGRDEADGRAETRDGRAETDADRPEARDGRDEVRSALAEIRREQYKVAFVHASLEAACVALAVHLLAGVAGFSVLDASPLASAFESSSVPAPDVGSLVALLAGVAAFAGAVVLRARRPAAEAFEAANPEVAEALRTARDAVRDDRANPMALALYDDVLDRLRETSSVRLVDRTRVVVAVVLAFALSLASVQTAVVGLDLAGPPSDAAVGGDGDSGTDDAALENRSSVELRDGDELLGEETDVDAGSENLTASVGSSPGGEGEEARNYDRDAGGGSDGAVDAERAGFDSPERVEDADLVARYARELEGNDTDV